MDYWRYFLQSTYGDIATSEVRMSCEYPQFKSVSSTLYMGMVKTAATVREASFLNMGKWPMFLVAILALHHVLHHEGTSLTQTHRTDTLSCLEGVLSLPVAPKE